MLPAPEKSASCTRSPARERSLLYVLFAYMLAPVVVAWLIILALGVVGVDAILRPGWTRPVGGALLASSVVLTGWVLTKPEIDDIKGSRRAAEVALIPRIPLPHDLPDALVMDGYPTREAMAVAQAFDFEVIRLEGSRSQRFDRYTQCPELKLPMHERPVSRVPCPPCSDDASLPYPYLLLRDDPPEHDRKAGIASAARLSLIDGDQEAMIEYLEVRTPLKRRPFDRIMGIF